MDSVRSSTTRGSITAMFMALLGFGGWAVLLAAHMVPESPAGGAMSDTPPLPFLIFLVVIVAARSMAFPLFTKTIVSLDSAFYVAATICLGSVTAGFLVAIALTLDALSRLFVTGKRLARRRPDWIEALTYVVYFGGMSGALLMLSAWLFDVDSVAVGPEIGRLDVFGRVIGVGLTLLLAHYSVQAARLKLLGRSFASFFRRTTLPGMVAEASLLPLAAVVVYVFHPEEPLGLALLGATYLVLNFAFSRLTRTSAQLRQRVAELETLNATARRLAASLERQELVEVVAHETLRAIPEAETLTLAHRDEEGTEEFVAEGELVPQGEPVPEGELVIDHYDRKRSRFRRLRVQAEGSAPGWVLSHGEPRLLADLSKAGLMPASGEARGAWIGVPIVIYGKVEGVLALQTSRRGAFGADHLRLLESIGAQATVALQNARLYELAMVDGLTGLFVRRYFDARLEEEVQRARRYGATFSVVMMDIDNFKELNDTHGHQAGDQVLRAISSIVRREMRAVDTAARYGGEEISFILPRTGVVEAYNVAERVREQISAFQSEAGLSVTASFGVASYPESGAADAEELLALADRALYRAKRTGKNRVELYWPDDRGEAPVLRTV
jgi:diguanylate cyclase (GGDEF)-like protein